METVQLATRIDRAQDQQFREVTRRLGTTPADAIRVFITAFNQHRGFPFEIRLAPEYELFETEEEATDFANDLSLRLLNETR